MNKFEWVDLKEGGDPPDDGKYHVVAVEGNDGSPVVLTEMYAYVDGEWKTEFDVGVVHAKLTLEPRWYIPHIPRPNYVMNGKLVADDAFCSFIVNMEEK